MIQTIGRQKALIKEKNMNKSKRKLLIFSLIALFVVISAVSVVAIVFAATKQTITANNLDLKWSATRNVYSTVDVTCNTSSTFKKSLTITDSTTNGTIDLNEVGSFSSAYVESGKPVVYVIFDISNDQPNATNNSLNVKLSYTAGTDTNVNVVYQYKKPTESTWSTLNSDGVTVARTDTSKTGTSNTADRVSVRIGFIVDDPALDAAVNGSISLILEAA